MLFRSKVGNTFVVRPRGSEKNVEISKGGDSGSVWLVDQQGPLATIGLLYKGDDDQDMDNEYAVGINLRTIEGFRNRKFQFS